MIIQTSLKDLAIGKEQHTFPPPPPIGIQFLIDDKPSLYLCNILQRESFHTS